MHTTKHAHIRQLLEQIVFARSLTPGGDAFNAAFEVVRLMLEERFGVREARSDAAARGLLRRRLV